MSVNSIRPNNTVGWSKSELELSDTAVPVEVVTRVIVAAGNSPICSQVSRGWYVAALAAYGVILDIFRKNETVNRLIQDSGSDFGVVKETYKHVMKLCRAISNNARSVITNLDLSQRLALEPVLQIAFPEARLLTLPRGIPLARCNPCL